jgi:hypothetical protein
VLVILVGFDIGLFSRHADGLLLRLWWWRRWDFRLLEVRPINKAIIQERVAAAVHAVSDVVNHQIGDVSHNEISGALLAILLSLLGLALALLCLALTLLSFELSLLCLTLTLLGFELSLLSFALSLLGVELALLGFHHALPLPFLRLELSLLSLQLASVCLHLTFVRLHVAFVLFHCTCMRVHWMIIDPFSQWSCAHLVELLLLESRILFFLQPPRYFFIGHSECLWECVEHWIVLYELSNMNQSYF